MMYLCVAILTVLEAADATGQGTFSRSLAALVQGYSLQDEWKPPPGRNVYTHYTMHGVLG
jgi:hypothetical protein